MQRTETVTIAGRTVVIREISVSKIYRLLRGDDSILDLPVPEALEAVKGLLPLAVDCDLSDLLDTEDLYYDDLILLRDAVKRTNPAFFELAGALGLDGALASTLKRLLESFSSRFVGLLNEDTAPKSGVTATDTSSI